MIPPSTADRPPAKEPPTLTLKVAGQKPCPIRLIPAISEQTGFAHFACFAVHLPVFGPAFSPPNRAQSCPIVLFSMFPALQQWLWLCLLSILAAIQSKCLSMNNLQVKLSLFQEMLNQGNSRYFLCAQPVKFVKVPQKHWRFELRGCFQSAIRNPQSTIAHAQTYPLPTALPAAIFSSACCYGDYDFITAETRAETRIHDRQAKRAGLPPPAH